MTVLGEMMLWLDMQEEAEMPRSPLDRIVERDSLHEALEQLTPRSWWSAMRPSCTRTTKRWARC